MAVKKAKTIKATKKREDDHSINLNRMADIVAETLQGNSEGEYALPATLVRYTNGPKAHLGLHREYYIPVLSKPEYLMNDTPSAWNIYRDQAAQIVQELVGNDFPINEGNFDLPLCKGCK